jgi:hypothetical protein
MAVSILPHPMEPMDREETMLSDEQLDDLNFDVGNEYNQPRTLDNFIKGLRILETLTDRKEYCLQGEHDEIYVYASAPTSDEQQIELDKLGFRYDDECESWRYYT